MVFCFGAQPLQDWENNAKNASVIVYGWSEHDQCMKMLLSRRNNGIWVFPGGGVKSSQNGRTAAAAELFEETAAFPKFNPQHTSKSFDKLPPKRKFIYSPKHSKTAVYIFNAGSIDADVIDDNWHQRVLEIEPEKRSDYKEMDRWQWKPLEDFFLHFAKHKNDHGNDSVINFDGLSFDGASYRALQAFAKRKFNFESLMEEERLKKEKVAQHAKKLKQKVVKKEAPFGGAYL